MISDDLRPLMPTALAIVIDSSRFAQHAAANAGMDRRPGRWRSA
jgi:hypothetical protein